jgi:hypothetical protein
MFAIIRSARRLPWGIRVRGEVGRIEVIFSGNAD